MSVENTLTPGAVTLGFRAPSTSRGPPELNEAASLKPALGRFAGTTEALTGDGAPRKVAVELFCSSIKGIVTLVSNGLKKPVAALLTTPSATAPAASALAPFWLKLHVPREMMTSAPAAPAG